MKKPLASNAALRRVTLIAGVLVAIALPGAAANAATGPAFGLRIFTGEDPTAAIFTSAKCVKENGLFLATAHDKGWALFVHLKAFTGFHPYKLERGHYSGAYIFVLSPSDEHYASDYIPPYNIPSGGQISFSHHGKIMGGGFYPMFSADGSNAVGVAGGLTCHYPKSKRRR